MRQFYKVILWKDGAVYDTRRTPSIAMAKEWSKGYEKAQILYKGRWEVDQDE